MGGIPIGGGAPVVIQSMLNTKTTDVEGSLSQIRALASAGCQIARLAVPNMESARTFAQICAESPLPLVADIHLLDIPGTCWGTLHAEQKEFGNNVL